MRHRNWSTFAHSGWWAGTLLLAGVLASASVASEISPLETQCRSLLRRQVFNCGCTASFLEAHFSREDGEILMTMWALAANESDQNQQFLNLYLRFGRKGVDSAVMNFHRHRDKLRSYCLQGAPNVSD
jgi:hypothetical protein